MRGGHGEDSAAADIRAASKVTYRARAPNREDFCPWIFPARLRRMTRAKKPYEFAANLLSTLDDVRAVWFLRWPV